MHKKIYKYAASVLAKSCLFPHPRPLCVYVGVAGRNDCSPKTSEPRPGKGAEPGQIQQIRRRGSAAEVPSVVLFQGYCTFCLHLMVECLVFEKLLWICCRCCCCSRCRYLSAEWEGLEEACNKRTAYLNKAMTREQVTVAKNIQNGLKKYFCMS